MKFLSLFIFFMITTCNAEALRDNLFHITAHFGGTYVITHATKVVCTKTLSNKHKLACTIAGVLISNGINIAYKAQEKFPNDTKRAIFAGQAGSALAAFMITLEW